MGYVVRQADLKRESQSILALWNRNSQAADRNRYLWIYGANRAGPSSAWVVTTEGGDIIGCAGLILRTMKVSTRWTQVGQAIDLMVDLHHRTIGPALQLQRAVTASSDGFAIPLIYAFPNGKSEQVLRRAGYHLLGKLEHWTKPLRSAYKIRDYVRSDLGVRAMAFVVDALLRFKDQQWVHQRSPEIRAVMLDAFDRRFDDLSDRVSGQFPIIGDRSSSYMRWRFGRYPGRAHNVFGLLNLEGQLQAYVVFYRKDQRIRIVDMLAVDTSALRLLLLEFSRVIRSTGGQALHVVYFGASWVGQALRQVGFIRRDREGSVLVYPRVGASAEFDLLLNPENWYLTEADWDI